MLTNERMAAMIEMLAPFLGRADIVGYAAARNTRILGEEAREYLERRDELLRQHGEMETDEDGRPTGRVTLAVSSPAYAAFLEGMADWGSIEHDPPIFKIKYDRVIGLLTGNEILALDWMLED